MPMAQKAGAWKLAKMMAKDTDLRVRRLAASYLAGLARQKASAVAKATLRVYRFKPRAKVVPWHGGPLYVPSISWDRAEAKKLVRRLLTWYIWCARHQKKKELRQIHNNIRSLRLARAAGYRSPGWRNVGLVRWMSIWKTTTSCREVRSMFKIQRSEKDFSRILASFGCPSRGGR